MAATRLVLSETSVTIADMKLFPACGEGFRRLSVVAGVVTCLLLFGWWVRDYSRENNQRLDICGQAYLTQIDSCASRMNPKDCGKMAFDEETRCYTSLRPKRTDIFTEWGLYAVGALIGAYFAALAIRTFGWTIQGFKANA